MNCNDITLINLNSIILVCWVCLHLVSSWDCDGCSEVPEEPLSIPNNEVLSPVEEPCAFTMVQRLGTREKSNEIHDLYVYESNNTENVRFHTRKATKTKPGQTEKNKHKKQQRKNEEQKSKTWGHQSVFGLFGWFFQSVFFPNAGSRFTLGVWGLSVCSLEVAQPFAAVRNHSREVAMALPLASSAKVVIFGGFKCRVASFRVAGVALCGIPTCFHTVSKIGLCDRGNTFASFSEDELRFSWQAQHFGDLHLRFAWQAQRFRRVVLCFLRIALSGLRQVVARWHSNYVFHKVSKIGLCDRVCVVFRRLVAFFVTEASHETSILR